MKHLFQVVEHSGNLCGQTGCKLVCHDLYLDLLQHLFRVSTMVYVKRCSTRLEQFIKNSSQLKWIFVGKLLRIVTTFWAIRAGKSPFKQKNSTVGLGISFESTCKFQPKIVSFPKFHCFLEYL